MLQQPVKELSGPNSPLEPVAIRNQLNRLLAHPLFTHSKRYPVLLEYIVEQTLLGRGADLKERTVGIEAFGREPEYDVNFDPVVRTSAAEVRKRLIQYYYDPAHSGELVIELFAGSYVPAFREPEPGRTDALEIDTESVRSDTPPAGARSTTLSSGEILERRRSGTRSWVLATVSILLALVVGIAIGRYRPPHPPSSIDRFWKPITSSPYPITYCLGEPAEAPELQSTLSGGDSSLRNSIYARLNVSDVLTLARTIVPLIPRHGAFRVFPASETSFEQLREGPVVLIGAFDNTWTMRLTEKLRFGFEIKDGVRRIVDRKSSNQKYWTLQWDKSHQKLVSDYAVVARIHDTTTGQPVIVVAGILGGGTEAASEVLYNPVYLNLLLDNAPKDWDRLNIEAVIGTHIIDGHPSPPEILAVETWQ
jgi:hypothetical protein